MDDAPRLLHGPYLAPEVHPGEWLDDDVAGRVVVGGYTSAPIPWPRRRKTGRHSPVLCGDLTRAVRLESSEAVQHWWGVGAVTVWTWRRALGVERVTEGTRELLRERTGVPPDAAARGRAKAASLESRTKMAATKRGKPMHPRTRAALLAAARRRKRAGWGIKANAWMRGIKLPTPVPWARYSEADLEFMRREYPRRPAREIAALLGRPLRSVYGTAWMIGLRRPDERWTPDEDALLAASSHLRLKDLSRLLGRTWRAVSYRRHFLGATKKRRGHDPR